MRFLQIDQITQLVPGKSIEATKALSGKEDYLRDHFPRFAVMPGVIMLEALFQAAAFLVRATDDYQSGLVMLHQANGVKFTDFVQPGETLIISCELLKRENELFFVKAKGFKKDSVSVSARLILLATSCNQYSDGQDDPNVDRHANHYMKQLSNRLQNAAMAGL